MHRVFFHLIKSLWKKQDPLLYQSLILRWCLERRAKYKDGVFKSPNLSWAFAWL